MTAIQSTRLRLEPLVAAHADEMFAPMSAAAIYEYMPERPPATLLALQQRYAQLERGHSADGRQQWLNWVVRLANGECTGFVQSTIYSARTADFAFAFAPAYWGRGVAHEACRAAIPHLCQGLSVTTLFATVDPRNLRSIRLLGRLGFSETTAAQYPHGQVEAGDRVFRLACAAGEP